MWPAVRVGFKQFVANVNGDSPAILQTLALRPAIFKIDNFVSKAECEQVLAVGMKKDLEPSVAPGHKKGYSH